ncbi:MAG: MFS transporter [Anaerolineae bacterium]|jgi:MFS family permease
MNDSTPDHPRPPEQQGRPGQRRRRRQRQLRLALDRATTILRPETAVAPASEEEVSAEMARHYRWNLAVNLLDGTAFWFALSFISSSTIVPLFISKLTDSRLLIGLAALVAQGGWFLPQLFTARWIEGRKRVKPVVVNLGFFLERLPTYLLPVAALLALRSPALALAVFFAGYLWRGLGAGAVGPAWQELVARCFPVKRRGRFLGTANFLGSMAGISGAALSTQFLEDFAFPDNFTYAFAIAAGATTLSWFFLALTREPAQMAGGARQGNRQFLKNLPGVVGRDQNFRRYLLARLLMALGSMGLGFVTVAAVERWQVADSTVGLYTAAYWLGHSLGNLSFGFMADRLGHKLALELGAWAAAAAFALAWLAPAPGWMFLVFVLTGIYVSATLSSGILVTLEFSAPQERPAYLAIANSTVGVANMVAPLAGAWLAGAGYAWTFAVATGFSLAAVAVMHWQVYEPRTHQEVYGP